MADRRELKHNYKEKRDLGGIYRIECGGNGRVWLRSARDLRGKLNRFQFSVSTGFCPETEMLREWEEFGPQSFSVTVLEELEMGKTQTNREFSDDLDALLQLWLEKSREGATGGNNHGG